MIVFLGVYLSRYSDLLQLNLFTSGTTGEIIIFKVMKVNQLLIIIIITGSVSSPFKAET